MTDTNISWFVRLCNNMRYGDFFTKDIRHFFKNYLVFFAPIVYNSIALRHWAFWRRKLRRQDFLTILRAFCVLRIKAIRTAGSKAEAGNFVALLVEHNAHITTPPRLQRLGSVHKLGRAARVTLVNQSIRVGKVNPCHIGLCLKWPWIWSGIAERDHEDLIWLKPHVNAPCLGGVF